MLVEDAEAEEFEDELKNFIEIETVIVNKYVSLTIGLIYYLIVKDIEEKFKNSEDTDESGPLTENDIKVLNKEIPPYKKGNAEITCHTAINIVNRLKN